MALVIAHPGLPLDHLGHPLQGPEFGGVAALQRALQEPSLHRRQLFWAEPGQAAGPLGSPHRLRRAPSLQPLVSPVARRLTSHPQDLKGLATVTMIPTAPTM